MRIITGSCLMAAGQQKDLQRMPLLLLLLSVFCLDAANDKLQEIDYKFTLYTHTHTHAYLHTPTHLHCLTNQCTRTHAEKQAL